MTPDFARLGVPASLVDVLAERSITTPTPIQAATLPDSLAGRDVLGRGRTGSGKTYAFLLPLVARLAADRKRTAPRRPRALILAPTRELVSQIADALEPLASAAGLSSRTVFGGVPHSPQVRALANGVDILIACPGRLVDLMERGDAQLDAVEITIIDEADHMADLGFLPMVRRVLDRTPARGQRLLFSATLDAGVDVLVKRYLHTPVVHQADSVAPVGEMEHHLLGVSAAHRGDVLAELAAAPGRTILFTRTKHGAKKLTKQLIGRGIPAVELHGNLGQNARTRNLDAFHAGQVGTLVATDIAARGIHVDDVALVVHADPPAEHKAYLHRSGRTARAGQSGTVLTLVTPDQRQAVAELMRAAKIKPTTSTVTPGDATLADLAPGERVYLAVAEAEAVANPTAVAAIAGQASAGRGAGGGRPSRRGGSGRGRSTARGAGSGQGESGRRRTERTGAAASQGSSRSQAAPRPGGASRPVAGSRGAAAFSASAGRSGRRR